MANRIFEIIERDQLADNARNMGAFLKGELQKLAQEFPQLLTAVRGVGLMIGFELAEKETIPALAKSDRAASLQLVDRLHDAGLLTIPSGTQKLRLLPALNLTRADAEEGIAIIRRVLQALA